MFRLFGAGASERGAEHVESKLQGLGFGFLVPVFFVMTAVHFDLSASWSKPRPAALWRKYEAEADIVGRLVSEGSSSFDDRAGQRARPKDGFARPMPTSPGPDPPSAVAVTDGQQRRRCRHDERGERGVAPRLYVAGQSPRSLAALSKLHEFCELHLAGRYEIETIDLVQHPERAGDDILAIPTVVRRCPSPSAGSSATSQNTSSCKPASSCGSSRDGDEPTRIVPSTTRRNRWTRRLAS